MTIAGVIDFEYTFSATQNNGRITKMKDWISGEEVNYAYDALNRLISATTTGPEYGLSFTYDGFGNKTSQSVTKGTAPAMSVSVDPATNRLIGVTYDPNGNQNSGAGWTYDVANRLMSASGEHYAYVASNKRVWKRKSSNVEEVYFYDLSGRRIGTYEMRFQGAQLRMVRTKEEFYFAGKLIRSGDDAIALDRLASVRYRRNLNTSAVERHDFYPYGEEKPGASAQERDKFATYHRDATGLDYADQRYFNSQHGRFLTADPARSSLNLYAYTIADPINSNDPTGLVEAPLHPFIQSWAYAAQAMDICWNDRLERYVPCRGNGNSGGSSDDMEEVDEGQGGGGGSPPDYSARYPGFKAAVDALEKNTDCRNLITGKTGYNATVAKNVLQSANIVEKDLGKPVAETFPGNRYRVDVKAAEVNGNTITVNSAIFHDPSKVIVTLPLGIQKTSYI